MTQGINAVNKRVDTPPSVLAVRVRITCRSFIPATLPGQCLLLSYPLLALLPYKNIKLWSPRVVRSSIVFTGCICNANGLWRWQVAGLCPWVLPFGARQV